MKRAAKGRGGAQPLVNLNFSETEQPVPVPEHLFTYRRVLVVSIVKEPGRRLGPWEGNPLVCIDSVVVLVVLGNVFLTR